MSNATDPHENTPQAWPMKFGFLITGGPVREQLALAKAAEAAGWDGVFTFDAIHVGDELEVPGPWALLGAFAAVTERVRLGAIIHPLPRRRPWEVAREATTVDQLSNGRLILPVGLGALDDAGFGKVGEPTDRRARAERLDESLAILAGLWSGEPFGYAGRHYRFAPMAFRPTPVQRPRIPIWVVGLWRSERSLQRVLRYDGLLPNYLPPEGGVVPAIPPEVVREMRAWLDARSGGRRLDIVMEGTTPADDRAAAVAQVQPLAEAGATWWIESDWTGGTPERMRRRAEAGPPAPAAPGARP
jgi:alkanesulfonate monooxygenase SsuD/methylene tetrahydromethanopterin reductase-like flavin-dependent oxidoreductase (luciferase family)